MSVLDRDVGALFNFEVYKLLSDKAARDAELTGSAKPPMLTRWVRKNTMKYLKTHYDHVEVDTAEQAVGMVKAVEALSEGAALPEVERLNLVNMRPTNPFAVRAGVPTFTYETYPDCNVVGSVVAQHAPAV